MSRRTIAVVALLAGSAGAAPRDDERWLEDLSDPKVQAWVKEQNDRTRRELDAMPGATAIRARLAELARTENIDYAKIQHAGGRLFALKEQPPRDLPFLVTFARLGDAAGEKVVVDPAAVDPSGRTAIDWYVPSLDGGKVAVSMSRDGTETGTVRVFDTATGKDLGEEIPRATRATAGGSLAWNAGGTGFWVTRYPASGEIDFHQQVVFHALGTPVAADPVVLGKELPRIAEVRLESSPDGKRVLALVAYGDGGEFLLFAGDGRSWRRVADLADRVVAARFAPDGTMVLLSYKGAPRGRVLALGGDEPLARARVVVAESDAAIESVVPGASRLFVTVQVGGPNELRVYDLAGKRAGDVPLPPIAAVDEVAVPRGDEALVKTESFVVPPRWLSYAGGSVTTAVAKEFPADLSGYEVVRDEAVSRDGTRVPLTIVARRGRPADGQSPAVLYGYGGYGISQKPEFLGTSVVFLEKGGVWAVAHLRGGGELGDDWHRAGMLTRKQNVFDDYAACARRLFELGITGPKRLVARGRSNGGLLMGAALTQHPELFAGIVAQVGIYDVLRVELGANGQYNIPEVGSVKDPAQRRALLAYSPLHRVRAGVAYPPLLLQAGLNDHRVQPWQSLKMAARLQAVSPAGRVLLRVSDAGHGASGVPLSETLAIEADIWAFVFDALGVAAP